MRAALIALMLVAGPAAACGYCVEDQIAAVYDHSVVTAALARKHHVVFLHVDGSVPSRALLQRAVYAAPGVDAGSVRISTDRLTVSFAFDPARASLGAIHPRIEKKLGVALMPLQVMERPGDLKPVNAPR